jgi:hypothetical protein
MLVASVVMAAVIGVTERFVNEDLYLAFAAGREVFRGNIVLHDHWSFTAEGRVWVNQAWLSHLILFLSYDLFGAAGPIMVKVILLTACLWLVFLRCSFLGVSPKLSLAGICVGTLAAAPFLGIRPENFGVFFFLLFCSLLTVNSVPAIARRFGVPLLLVLWSDSHGSFMLGLGLLGVKAGLVTLRSAYFGQIRHPNAHSASAREWWILAAVSLAAVAVGTPFGIANLLMPFQQVGSPLATSFSADWLPLLSFYPTEQGLLGPGSVYLFLALLVLFLVGGMLATIERIRRNSSLGAPVPLGSDWLMELLIGLVTVMLAFKFRRLVLFSALSLVPITAFFFQSWFNRRSFALEAPHPSNRRDESWKFATAAALLTAMSFFCWRAAIVPFLPGNPLRPERPLAQELMSFDSFSPHLVEFMKKNNVDGRVLSGWGISSYLMYHVPSIKLFMDCRDQSLYPERVIRDFFTILGIVPPHGRTPDELLDEYKVSTVVLTTDPIDFDLAVRLMQSKKWISLYADFNSVVLVRSDSPRWSTAGESQEPEGIWFPNEETRLLTRAFRSYFRAGRVPPELVPELQEAAHKNPHPNYYSFIVSGMDLVAACFKPSTVECLSSEAALLDRIDPRSPGGGLVTESLEKIYAILEAHAHICGDAGSAERFGAMKTLYRARLRELRRRYLGIVF